MRVLVLFFPRLGIQLARKFDATIGGRPFALAAGSADGALLSAVSCEATKDGVEPGMTLLQARQRCPGLATAADNGADCLEALENTAAIIRSRATTSVALLTRNALAVSLAGLEGRVADEASAAAGILGLARSWSGLDVRGAVASTIEEAFTAARTARRHAAMVEATEGGADIFLPVYEPVSAAFTFGRPASQQEAEARLARMAASLSPLLEPRSQSYRLVTLELEYGSRRRALALRPTKPLHHAAEAIDIVRSRVPAAQFEGVTGLRLTLGRPGPGLEVQPWRAAVASIHQLSAPAVPVQRRLLRAS